MAAGGQGKKSGAPQPIFRWKRSANEIPEQQSERVSRQMREFRERQAQHEAVGETPENEGGTGSDPEQGPKGGPPEESPSQGTERGASQGPSQERPSQFRFARVPTQVLDESWGPKYQESSRWGEWWNTVNAGGSPWPEGVQLWDGKMYRKGKMCVPGGLSGRLVRAHHAQVGHVGGKRLEKELHRIYVFEPGMKMWRLIRAVSKGREVCLAHHYPNH